MPEQYKRFAITDEPSSPTTTVSNVTNEPDVTSPGARTPAEPARTPLSPRGRARPGSRPPSLPGMCHNFIHTHCLNEREATMESRPMQGRVALVAGASKGIGAATAEAFAAAGASVVLAARDLAALEAVAKRITDNGGQAGAGRADGSTRPSTSPPLARCRPRWPTSTPRSSTPASP